MEIINRLDNYSIMLDSFIPYITHGSLLNEYLSIILDILVCMKNSKEKIPNCLVDSCKRSSVNRMAAGSRLPRSSHEIFTPFY